MQEVICRGDLADHHIGFFRWCTAAIKKHCQIDHQDPEELAIGPVCFTELYSIGESPSKCTLPDLEAPFASMHAIAPLIDPLSYYLFGFWSLGPIFDNLSKVRLLKTPLMIIHGTGDDIVPISMSRQLHQHAPLPKKLLEIAGAGHSNSFQVDRESYRNAWIEFTKTASGMGVR